MCLHHEVNEMINSIQSLLHNNVLVEFVDGGGMQGYFDSYLSAADNYPDSESIVLRCRKVLYEIATEEIKKITKVD